MVQQKLENNYPLAEPIVIINSIVRTLGFIVVRKYKKVELLQDNNPMSLNGMIEKFKDPKNICGNYLFKYYNFDNHQQEIGKCVVELNP